jgi:flagellar protein FliO/FliZ
MNGLVAITVVLGLLGGVLWLLKRGPLGRLAARSSAVSIETAVSLGERRQLVVVAVEGRRLLLGVTAAQVALVTELQAQAPQEVQS